MKMRIQRDCGMSFKLWSGLTIAFEVISSVVVVLLALLAYWYKVGRNIQLIYTPNPGTNYIKVNETYEVVVTSWIVLILLVFSAARFLNAIILSVTVKKSSAGLGQFWLTFKALSLIISLFLATASFNVSQYVIIASLVALATDLVSSYFILLLYPELDRMRKAIVFEVNPPKATDIEEIS